jgi:hypothetical protein
MTSSALWNDRSKTIRYDNGNSKTATATSVAVVIFLIIASTSMALTYIRLHVEQNKLNAEINTITGNMAVRSKEIDNLHVRLEHLKGQEVMRFAPRLGLVPPAFGQVTRLSLGCSSTKVTNMTSATAQNLTINKSQPGVSNIP